MRTICRWDDAEEMEVREHDPVPVPEHIMLELQERYAGVFEKEDQGETKSIYASDGRTWESARDAAIELMVPTTTLRGAYANGRKANGIFLSIVSNRHAASLKPSPKPPRSSRAGKPKRKVMVEGMGVFESICAAAHAVGVGRTAIEKRCDGRSKAKPECKFV